MLQNYAAEWDVCLRWFTTTYLSSPLAPPRKLNHPRGEFNQEASGAQRAVCLYAVNQQTNLTNGHKETQNALLRGKKKQNKISF